MPFQARRPGSMANLDPEGTFGWTELAGRWNRTANGHRLEVWREPRGGPWRWSLDGLPAPRAHRSRDAAMRSARRGAELGRVPGR